MWHNEQNAAGRTTGERHRWVGTRGGAEAYRIGKGKENFSHERRSDSQHASNVLRAIRGGPSRRSGWDPAGVVSRHLRGSSLLSAQDRAGRPLLLLLLD